MLHGFLQQGAATGCCNRMLQQSAVDCRSSVWSGTRPAERSDGERLALRTDRCSSFLNGGKIPKKRGEKRNQLHCVFLAHYHIKYKQRREVKRI